MPTIQQLVRKGRHNKVRKTPFFINILCAGENVAIASDAGTPGISDPAYYLVRRAADADIPIVPIPGPTAAIAALTVSGLPTDRFVFEGFLPAKKGRNKRLASLREEARTIILYESPHRQGPLICPAPPVCIGWDFPERP